MLIQNRSARRAKTGALRWRNYFEPEALSTGWAGFLAGADRVRALASVSRWLSPLVSMIRQRWVRRSSVAPVSRSEPRTSVQLPGTGTRSFA